MSKLRVGPALNERPQQPGPGRRTDINTHLQHFSQHMKARFLTSSWFNPVAG